jgi:hypothetical protein
MITERHKRARMGMLKTTEIPIATPVPYFSFAYTSQANTKFPANQTLTKSQKNGMLKVTVT